MVECFQFCLRFWGCLVGMLGHGGLCNGVNLLPKAVDFLVPGGTRDSDRSDKKPQPASAPTLEG